jgi:hypothetical protein
MLLYQQSDMCPNFAFYINDCLSLLLVTRFPIIKFNIASNFSLSSLPETDTFPFKVVHIFQVAHMNITKFSKSGGVLIGDSYMTKYKTGYFK